MIDTLKVALVQFEPKPLNKKHDNLAYHLEKIEQLVDEGYRLIVFPEMSLTGFFVHQPGERRRYWEEDAETVPGKMTDALVEATEKFNCYVIVGIAERGERACDVYNSVVLIGPEGIIGTTRKLHLPGPEKMYYKEGNIGNVYDTDIGKIGMMICYEAFFPEVSRLLALRGADILVAPSSIWKGGKSGGIGGGKSKHTLFTNTPVIRALENQVHFLLCNAAGSQYLGESLGTWERFGESKIVNAQGEIVAASDSNKTEIIGGEIHNASLLESRANYMLFSDRRPRFYSELGK